MLDGAGAGGSVVQEAMCGVAVGSALASEPVAQGHTVLCSAGWGSPDSLPDPSRSRFLQFSRSKHVVQIQSEKHVESLAT